MRMNVAEMKVEMIGILTQVVSEDKIARFYEKLYEVMEAPEDDWWDDLSPFQQKQLLLSLEESKSPENLVDYSDIKKKYAKWFKK
jgi:hypothetical protein